MSIFLSGMEFDLEGCWIDPLALRILELSLAFSLLRILSSVVIISRLLSLDRDLNYLLCLYAITLLGVLSILFIGIKNRWRTNRFALKLHLALSFILSSLDVGTLILTQRLDEANKMTTWNTLILVLQIMEAYLILTVCRYFSTWLNYQIQRSQQVKTILVLIGFRYEPKTNEWESLGSASPVQVEDIVFMQIVNFIFQSHCLKSKLYIGFGILFLRSNHALPPFCLLYTSPSPRDQA
eukprot:TRINITY_DN27986_c0_g1_i1.p1 TRINITY_DN27986_c0_g1~~TRINITY_DN27986_c0_g1_i1.p1  ORF type:complete len:238 (+),score=-0.69 TRINITY_DN27986_c0_g1_i1:84-797(+)